MGIQYGLTKQFYTIFDSYILLIKINVKNHIFISLLFYFVTVPHQSNKVNNITVSLTNPPKPQII